MRFAIIWMGKNPIVANMIMMFAILLGFISMQRMRRESLPEFSLDKIQIRVPYLGASPEDVELGVCQRIEERLVGMEAISRIQAVAADGVGLVTVDLERGADVAQMLDDIKIAIDRIDTFPDETEKPIIVELTNRSRVINVVVYGDVSEKTLKYWVKQVQDDLRRIDGISQIERVGVRTDEISIEVSERALRRHGLTFDQVMNAVKRTSLNVPGGRVKSRDGEILVRTEGLKYTGEEYENVVVTTRTDGTTLTLGQIATIVDGFEDRDVFSWFNSQPAAVLQVYRIGAQDALHIAETVRGYVAAKQEQLPAGVHLDYTRDETQLLDGRLDLVLENGWMGLVLVFICLSFFMDLHLAFWVMLGIPISFMGCFILLYPLGASINMVSLFGFVIVLAIVVDDAIVVGESIYVQRERLEGRNGRKNRTSEPEPEGSKYKRSKFVMRAAIDGALNVATPVTFSVFTSIVAFMPMLFAEGMMGKFMAVIPVVVISVLLFSLFESLFILPAHLASHHSGRFSHMLQDLFKVPLVWQGRARDWLDRHMRAFIETHYERGLRAALVNPLATIGVGIALMLVTAGWIGGGHIKFLFLPKIDSDWLTISVAMPQGASAEQTGAVVGRIEDATKRVIDSYEKQEEMDTMFRSMLGFVGAQPVASGGGSGAHLGEVTIELRPSENRPVSTSQIADQIRTHVGEIPGVASLTFTVAQFTVGKAIEVHLASDDFAQLMQAVARLKTQIAKYPGATDIQDSFEEGKLTMRLSLKPQARSLGITQADLARQVRHGFYGAEALRLPREGEDVRVMIRYPEAERRSIGDIEQIRIRTPDGVEVPFSQVANAELVQGFAAIQRSDAQRTVSVTADVDEETANADEINRDLIERFLPALIQDYPGLRYSYEGQQREQQDFLRSITQGYLVALLVIYALLAIPTRSYTQPLVVMSAIPFGVIGAVWGHVILGIELTSLSITGIVALSGVVVNDSLLLLSFYNQLRKRGMARDGALLEAGKQRFRPILLTSLTTFLGLLPIMLEQSMQAQFLIPMAVSLGFGILFATVIILVGIPAGMKILGQLLDWLDIEELEDEEEGQTPITMQEHA